MTKINVSLIVIILAVICLICIAYYDTNTYGFFDQEKIFDDLNIIIQDYDSYSYLIKKGQNVGNTSDLEFYFTGMDTIWNINAQNDGVLHVSYQSVIINGEFKVLLIAPDNKIVTILEQSESGEKDIRVLEGISIIKIVGRNAEGRIKMILTANQWLDIIPIND